MTEHGFGVPKRKHFGRFIPIPRLFLGSQSMQSTRSVIHLLAAKEGL